MLRKSVFMIAIAAAGCAVPCAVLSARSLWADEQLQGHKPARMQLAFTYPARVRIPDDVPSVAVGYEKTGAERVILPAAIYLYGHYDGWQEFLEAYATKPVKVADMKWEPPIRSMDQQYTAAAMKEGFEACRRHAERLNQEFSENELKRAANRAYKSRHPGPPPR